jgi:hypothetical protein
LAGSQADGTTPLLIEAKFWAGLTENQPNEYLKALPEHTSGLLLFVCPMQRVELLWPKLLHRAGVTTSVRIESGYYYAAVPPNGTLAIVSWRQLLAALMSEGERTRDNSLLSDVGQLDGLCSRMDSQAFLPLREVEMGSDIGSRVQQFADLVDSIVRKLAERDDADTKGLKNGGQQSTYGRYLRLGEFGLLFHYSPQLWSRFEGRPFWLTVQYISPESGWRNAVWIQSGLEQLLAGDYVVVPASEMSSTVGLSVPTGVELSDVEEGLACQILDVLAHLRTHKPKNAL